MLLIFGTRSIEDVLRVLVFVCRVCGVRDEQRVIRSRTRLSLFFVPLFTVSSRYLLECDNCGTVPCASSFVMRDTVPQWSRYLLECDHCGTVSRITKEEAQGTVRWAGNSDA